MHPAFAYLACEVGVFGKIFKISSAKGGALYIDAGSQNSGLTLDFGNNASAWFVSSLFWSCLFYYILHSVLSERGFFLTVSLIAYFAFVLMVHGNNGSFNAHLKPTFYSLLNFGMLRAIAEIGLGLGVGHVYDALSNIPPPSRPKKKK